MKLQLYVLGTVATRILGAALILMSILQILDLLDVTTDILDRGLGVAGVAYYAALRLPRLFEQVAPIAVLAGGLFAFSQLARESAVVAMRASGVSGYRIVGMAVPAAVAVMLLDALCGQVLAPRADPTLADWWKNTTPVAERKVPAPRTFRAGADLVIGASASADGRQINDIVVFRRDAKGILIEKVEAPKARYHSGAWTLDQPKTTRFTGDLAQSSTAATTTWPTALKPQDVQGLFGEDAMPTAASARRALQNGGSDRPESFYATHLQAAFASPFVSLVMLLLSAPVALANFRSGQGAVLLTTGLAAGLLFLVANGMLTALGESGSLSPWLAVWAAPAIFGALAVRTFLALEG
ncbi:LptF/LptG family permease [Caulobacter segnis]|jgi:lipopolysaccharide export system permease protein|uniref:LptF/LptG family permease n=1 Tax=Caulobacter segnis TaxID=88688 RepID=UPI001CBCDC42|nr:LptF/LptG family permease [Caulobacter segnis]UAL08829.1 LptF/LptG family permease [Caulobacter segnis]